MSFMNDALAEAKIAYDKNEVPVGAVIVKSNEIIASAHNMCEEMCDATAHAEIIAIKDAQKKLGRKILNDCDIYVTLEPCAMCAGAIVNARLKRVYIGANEPKTGCMGSVANIHNLLPHKVETYYGFSEDKCKNLIKKFFETKR